jgi:hypothetical protein
LRNGDEDKYNLLLVWSGLLEGVATVSVSFSRYQIINLKT